MGVVTGEQGGAGRENKERQQEREKHESGDGLPAQDDFQLAAVELPAVGQTHDALLVACQVLHIHLLDERKITVSVTSCEFNLVCEERANDARHVCMGMLPAEREDLW